MTTDRRRNKLTLDQLKQDFNSMARSNSHKDITKSMAVAHRFPSRYEDGQGIVDAILPLVPEKQRKRVKREFTIDTSRIACSLDFLAAIADEQARSEMQGAYESSGTEDDAKDDEICDRENDLDLDADETELVHEGYDEKYDDLDTKLDSESSDEHHMSPEERAAAVLLMAKLVHRYPAPKRKRHVDADEFEGGSLRSRRLSQNQLYRKRLNDKGVYPIRRGPKHYACSLCREVFEKEMFVWRHGVKHLETKPFQCSMCGGRFNRSDSLQRHVRNFHKKV